MKMSKTWIYPVILQLAYCALTFFYTVFYPELSRAADVNWLMASGQYTGNHTAAVDSWRHDKEFASAWPAGGMHAEEAYVHGISGQGVKVGVLDSGADITHPELASPRIHTVLTDGHYADDGFRYFADGNKTPLPVKRNDPYSVSGAYDPLINDSHGTLVTGAIGAARNGTGMQGVAWHSEVYVANTGGTDENQAQGSDSLDYNYSSSAYAALGNAGVRIVNQSWGQNSPIEEENLTDNTAQMVNAYRRFSQRAASGDKTWLDAAAEAVQKYHYIGVISASNDPQKNPDMLAALPYYKPEIEKDWLAVSGYSPAGQQVYNQCGVARYWCVMAPTVARSTQAGGGYSAGFNGTSASAPYASGALALVMQRFPYMTAEQALSVMLTTSHELVAAPGVDTSRPITEYASPDYTQGTWGYLTPLADGAAGAPNAITGWGLIDVAKAMNGPAQFLGNMSADLPTGMSDTWSNDITDKATIARRAFEQSQLDELRTIVQTGKMRDGDTGKTVTLSQDQLSVVRSLISAKENILAGYGKDPLTGQTFVGSLTKTGPGSLILTGNNTYTGSTWVKEGRLAVNGSVTSDVTVQTSGVLGGSGRTGAITVRQGGTVAPGNSVGTLTATGNITFEPGSHYAAEVSPDGRSDLLTTSGKVILNGGDVSVLAENTGNLLSMTQVNSLAGKTFRILNATQGVSGRFSAVEPDYLFLGTGLAYDSSGVTLTTGRNNTSFASAARTPNERAVAGALETLSAGQPVHESMLMLASPDEAAAAYRALTGQLHADISRTLTDGTWLVRDTLNARMQSYGQNVTASGIHADENGIWARMLGNWGHSRGDSGDAGSDNSVYGVMFGADRKIAVGGHLGVAGGYSRTSLDAGYNGSADVDTWHAAGYGSWPAGPLTVRGGADLAWHRIGTDRVVAYGSQHDRETAHYSARSGQVFADAGWEVLGGGTESLEPYAGMSFTSLTRDTFRESGGAAALSGRGGDEMHTVLSEAGLRGRREWQMTGDTTLSLQAGAGWQHALRQDEQRTDLQFSSGEAFAVRSPGINRNALVLNAGLSIRAGKNMVVTLNYGGRLSGAEQNSSAGADLSWRF